MGLEMLFQSWYRGKFFATQVTTQRQLQQLTGAFFYCDLSIRFKHMDDICREIIMKKKKHKIIPVANLLVTKRQTETERKNILPVKPTNLFARLVGMKKYLGTISLNKQAISIIRIFPGYTKQ